MTHKDHKRSLKTTHRVFTDNALQEIAALVKSTHQRTKTLRYIRLWKHTFVLELQHGLSLSNGSLSNFNNVPHGVLQHREGRRIPQAHQKEPGCQQHLHQSTCQRKAKKPPTRPTT